MNNNGNGNEFKSFDASAIVYEGKIDPPFTKVMVSEAIITTIAALMAFFPGFSLKSPANMTEEDARKGVARATKAVDEDPVDALKQIGQAIQEISGISESLAMLMAVRGVRVLANAELVWGTSLDELTGVESELVIADSDEGVVYFGLRPRAQSADQSAA